MKFMGVVDLPMNTDQENKMYLTIEIGAFCCKKKKKCSNWVSNLQSVAYNDCKFNNKAVVIISTCIAWSTDKVHSIFLTNI